MVQTETAFRTILKVKYEEFCRTQRYDIRTGRVIEVGRWVCIRNVEWRTREIAHRTRLRNALWLQHIYTKEQSFGESQGRIVPQGTFAAWLSLIGHCSDVLRTTDIRMLENPSHYRWYKCSYYTWRGEGDGKDSQLMTRSATRCMHDQAGGGGGCAKGRRLDKRIDRRLSRKLRLISPGDNGDSRYCVRGKSVGESVNSIGD